MTSSSFPLTRACFPAMSAWQLKLTRNITLNIPLVSAAMDTVTEVASGHCPGAGRRLMGIVHKNLKPAEQAAEVSKVKRYESGVLKDPITIPPTMLVRDVITLTRTHKLFRPAGCRRQARGGHRHQPRPAFRNQSGPAGQRHHDAG